MLRNSILATLAAMTFSLSLFAKDYNDLDAFSFPELEICTENESDVDTVETDVPSEIPIEEKEDNEENEDEPTKLPDVFNLWATYYYLPELNEKENGEYPLRNMDGEPVGPSLSLREWCDTAMEGSVKINHLNGEVHTYNYQGITNDHYVDCTSIYPRHPAIGKTKYRMANGVFGDGVGEYILSPYRTIATDPKLIPTGTVLFIPEAKGAKITTSTGKTIIHDGYFFAGDIGGAIKGNHIDVYIGTSKKAQFFPWIKSKESGIFKAHVVKDEKIISDLRDLHIIK